MWDSGEKKALTELANSRYLASKLEFQILQQQVEQSKKINFERMKLLRKRLQKFTTLIDSLTIEISYSFESPDTPIEEIILFLNKKINILNMKIQKIERIKEYQIAYLNFLLESGKIMELMKYED